MFKFEEDKDYSMPPFFGPTTFGGDFTATANTLALSFTFNTDGKSLDKFLPKGFELLKPELTISLSQLRACNWFVGGGYNLIQVQVPARFNGKHDQLEGVFPLVIWENNTIPIIGGREQSGQPKIFADIQDLHAYDGRYFTNASIFGETFLRLEMSETKLWEKEMLEKTKAAGPISSNVFGWRYIPNVNGKGATLNEPILYPQSTTIMSGWYGKGAVEWIANEKNVYNHIIKQLADLPVYGNISATSVSGTIFMNAFKGRVLR
ncbi:acetoacetate decarboxylase family protein [Clostridium sp. JS66]|uniref:acetoacetate decarboxylase family protein n=1 Tax=Clostridium sp. JS66 TaxID=3064705 RepID=UPI00298DE1A1|nr:acetoacetate decarboxylase family protein [Clostridium sp. JS66]WPC39769.1 acetoacetate decarboxylase family protein [Clostridium sp. JS66]